MNNSLSQETLKKILNYDPATGIFTWIYQASTSILIGDRAGTYISTGYILVMIKRKRYLAHRLAWLYMTGEFPENEVDHINRIKDDNRFMNLRACTRSQNLANSKKQKNNTSGYKGVCWNRRDKKWVANVGFQGKQVYCGQSDCKHEAAQMYNERATEIYGEFVCLNEIKDLEDFVERVARKP